MEIKGDMSAFRKFLQEGAIQMQKALIRNCVTDVEIVEDEVGLA